MQEKCEVRREVYKKRKELIPEQGMILSKKIFDRVRQYLSGEEETGYREADVYVYASCQNEVNTWEFICECLEEDRRVALPRVCSDGVHMEFFYIHSPEDVIEGYKGILEPGLHCKKAEERRKKIILIPGVGFDRKRNRVGYGKGFYDRYLAGRSFEKRIGLAYEFQIFDEIACDTGDIRPDAVITEKAVYR